MRARRRPLLMSTLALLAASGGRWRTAALVVGNVAQGVLYPLVALTAKKLADAVLGGQRYDAVYWVAVELGLVVLATVLARLATDARILLRGRVGYETRIRIAEKQSALDLAELDDPELHDRIASIRDSADTRPLRMVVDALSVARSAVGLVVYVALLAVHSVWALALLLAIVPGIVVEVASARRQARDHDDRMRDERRLGYLHDVLFSERLAAETRLLGLLPPWLTRSYALGRRLHGGATRQWGREVVFSLAGQLLPTLVVNGCYLAMAIATVRGHLTVGELTLYGMSMTAAQQLGQLMLQSGRSMLESAHHVRMLVDFLDSPPHAAAAPAAPSLVRDAAAPQLRLENVGFRYPGADTWAVRNLDLDVAPGELVAIIGGNGSGKTTLVKLMTGLLRPTEGRITLDGRDLTDFPPEQLRRRFAIVFQRFARYGASLADNVAVASTAAAGDALERVLPVVGADEMVAQLPRGLDTELDPALADGVGLSGGQWQRIALARALVRETADYLVLDEPTSALDAESERRVFDHLRRLARDKAVIVITHRSALLRPSDKVVALERGERRVEVSAAAVMARGASHG